MQIKTTMRYHPTPVRIAIMKKKKKYKQTRRKKNKKKKKKKQKSVGKDEIGTLVHCWWRRKMVQLLCKTVRRFLKKIKNKTTI